MPILTETPPPWKDWDARHVEEHLKPYNDQAT
jgi:hypothetical protein